MAVVCPAGSVVAPFLRSHLTKSASDATVNVVTMPEWPLPQNSVQITR